MKDVDMAAVDEQMRDEMESALSIASAAVSTSLGALRKSIADPVVATAVCTLRQAKSALDGLSATVATADVIEVPS